MLGRASLKREPGALRMCGGWWRWKYVGGESLRGGAARVGKELGDSETGQRVRRRGSKLGEGGQVGSCL